MDGTYLIIATSARSLIASARRSGIAVRAIDCFADADYPPDIVSRVTGDMSGFAADSLLAAVDTLLEQTAIAGIIVGSGFEQRPELLDALASRAPLLGNPATPVRRLKSPTELRRILVDIGIDTPQVQVGRPCPEGNWLLKRIGGSGGVHICPAIAGESCPAQYYWQARIEGSSGSALFLATDGVAQLLGVAEHWQAQPLSDADFRHSGLLAARPDPEHWERLQWLTTALVATAGLRGLNGVDYIRRDDGAVVVTDVNPRPTASVDLFDLAPPFLFARHIWACQVGRPAPQTLQPTSSRASAVLYSPVLWQVPRNIEWPVWITDRPQPGQQIRVGEPLCTVHGEASSGQPARARVCARVAVAERLTGLQLSDGIGMRYDPP